MKVAKQYAKLRDEQFSLYEHYARQHGMNYKGLLILLWLYNNPKGISQKILCEKTYSTKQVVHAIIQGYLQKGYAILEPSETDKRQKRVLLTESGYHYAEAIIAPLDRMEEQAIAQLDDRQIEVLLRGTDFFTQSLKREMGVR